MNIFFAFAMLVMMTSAMNVSNETTSIHDGVFLDEHFYSIDVLLRADDAQIRFERFLSVIQSVLLSILGRIIPV